MLYSVIFDDEIKIFWDYVKLEKNQSFLITKDNKEFFTQKSHYNFKDLTPSTLYNFTLKIVDLDNRVIRDVDSISVTTKNKKIKIDITKPPYNAIGDGVTLNTEAIQKAINDCGENTCVYVPDGVFITGALDMGSNTELYLSQQAVLQGTDEPKDYLPKINSRFEGWEMMCYRSLINIGKLDHTKHCDTENIIIRGGTILGGGNSLKKNIIERERIHILREYGLENEKSPDGLYSSIMPGRTRGRLVCCNNAKNVVIANTVMGNGPAWNLHFIYSENVVTCGCSIVSHNIKNGDGWDPDSSKNCVIFDTYFDTGDDCVAIKSGKNPEGNVIARPSEHIKVFDIYSKEGHGIAIGSEMSGGVEDVKIWNVNINYGVGLCIKSRSVRGGYIKNVGVYNCNFPLISVDEYRCCDDGEPAPTEAYISGLHFEDIVVNGVLVFTGETNRKEPENAIIIRGSSKENPIKNVVLKNITLLYRQMMSYQMISLHNVENLSLENITCEGEVR